MRTDEGDASSRMDELWGIASSADSHELGLRQLDKCLNELDRSDRCLLLDYYNFENDKPKDHRAWLAGEVGLSVGGFADKSLETAKASRRLLYTSIWGAIQDETENLLAPD